MVTPVAMEPLLGYHPCSIGFLTSRRDPAVGQCPDCRIHCGGSREWKARCKRGTSHSGKSGWQWEAVMRIEIQVEKSVSHASRKAAIVYTVPVP